MLDLQDPSESGEEAIAYARREYIEAIQRLAGDADEPFKRQFLERQYLLRLEAAWADRLRLQQVLAGQRISTLINYQLIETVADAEPEDGQDYRPDQGSGGCRKKINPGIIEQLTKEFAQVNVLFERALREHDSYPGAIADKGSPNPALPASLPTLCHASPLLWAAYAAERLSQARQLAAAMAVSGRSTGDVANTSDNSVLLLAGLVNQHYKPVLVRAAKAFAIMERKLRMWGDQNKGTEKRTFDKYCEVAQQLLAERHASLLSGSQAQRSVPRFDIASDSSLTFETNVIIHNGRTCLDMPGDPEVPINRFSYGGLVTGAMGLFITGAGLGAMLRCQKSSGTSTFNNTGASDHKDKLLNNHYDISHYSYTLLGDIERNSRHRRGTARTGVASFFYQYRAVLKNIESTLNNRPINYLNFFSGYDQSYIIGILDCSSGGLDFLARPNPQHGKVGAASAHASAASDDAANNCLLLQHCCDWGLFRRVLHELLAGGVDSEAPPLLISYGARSRTWQYLRGVLLAHNASDRREGADSPAAPMPPGTRLLLWKAMLAAHCPDNVTDSRELSRKRPREGDTAAQEDHPYLELVQDYYSTLVGLGQVAPVLIAVSTLIQRMINISASNTVNEGDLGSKLSDSIDYFQLYFKAIKEKEGIFGKDYFMCSNKADAVLKNVHSYLYIPQLPFALIKQLLQKDRLWNLVVLALQQLSLTNADDPRSDGLPAAVVARSVVFPLLLLATTSGAGAIPRSTTDDVETTTNGSVGDLHEADKSEGSAASVSLPPPTTLFHPALTLLNLYHYRSMNHLGTDLVDDIYGIRSIGGQAPRSTAEPLHYLRPYRWALCDGWRSGAAGWYSLHVRDITHRLLDATGRLPLFPVSLAGINSPRTGYAQAQSLVLALAIVLLKINKWYSSQLLLYYGLMGLRIWPEKPGNQEGEGWNISEHPGLVLLNQITEAHMVFNGVQEQLSQHRTNDDCTRCTDKIKRAIAYYHKRGDRDKTYYYYTLLLERSLSLFSVADIVSHRGGVTLGICDSTHYPSFTITYPTTVRTAGGPVSPDCHPFLSPQALVSAARTRSGTEWCNHIRLAIDLVLDIENRVSDDTSTAAVKHWRWLRSLTEEAIGHIVGSVAQSARPKGVTGTTFSDLLYLMRLHISQTLSVGRQLAGTEGRGSTSLMNLYANAIRLIKRALVTCYLVGVTRVEAESHGRRQKAAGGREEDDGEADAFNSGSDGETAEERDADEESQCVRHSRATRAVVKLLSLLFNFILAWNNSPDSSAPSSLSREAALTLVKVIDGWSKKAFDRHYDVRNASDSPNPGAIPPPPSKHGSFTASRALVDRILKRDKPSEKANDGTAQSPVTPASTHEPDTRPDYIEVTIEALTVDVSTEGGTLPGLCLPWGSGFRENIWGGTGSERIEGDALWCGVTCDTDLRRKDSDERSYLSASLSTAATSLIWDVSLYYCWAALHLLNNDKTSSLVAAESSLKPLFVLFSRCIGHISSGIINRSRGATLYVIIRHCKRVLQVDASSPLSVGSQQGKTGAPGEAESLDKIDELLIIEKLLADVDASVNSTNNERTCASSDGNALDLLALLPGQTTHVSPFRGTALSISFWKEWAELDKVSGRDTGPGADVLAPSDRLMTAEVEWLQGLGLSTIGAGVGGKAYIARHPPFLVEAVLEGLAVSHMILLQQFNEMAFTRCDDERLGLFGPVASSRVGTSTNSNSNGRAAPRLLLATVRKALAILELARFRIAIILSYKYNSRSGALPVHTSRSVIRAIMLDALTVATRAGLDCRVNNHILRNDDDHALRHRAAMKVLSTATMKMITILLLFEAGDGCIMWPGVTTAPEESCEGLRPALYDTPYYSALLPLLPVHRLWLLMRLIIPLLLISRGSSGGCGHSGCPPSTSGGAPLIAMGGAAYTSIVQWLQRTNKPSDAVLGVVLAVLELTGDPGGPAPADCFRALLSQESGDMPEPRSFELPEVSYAAARRATDALELFAANVPRHNPALYDPSVEHDQYNDEAAMTYVSRTFWQASARLARHYGRILKQGDTN